MLTAAPPTPGAQPWLSSSESSHHKAPVGSPHEETGRLGTDFRLCPALPSNTLCGNSGHFLSAGVSYSDDCNGEWLVFFILFCFLMVDEMKF